MSDSSQEPPFLRTVLPTGGGLRAPLGGEYGVNELAVVRGRARQTGSFAQALVEEGIASSDGIARILAARHQLPLVDLALADVDEAAARLIPLHVLERVIAIPYGLRGDTLLVAVADPANLHGIDELRLGTRHPVELGVASREDILGAVRKLVRNSEAFGARVALADEEDDDY